MIESNGGVKKTILVFTQWYLPGYKGGGPVKTLTNLIDATHNDHNYYVVTRDRDLGDSQAYTGVDAHGWNRIGHARVRYIAPGWRGVRQILHVMRSTSFDVLYLNSFFSTAFSLLPLLINRRLGKPVIVGPRGQFSRGALSLSALKKRVYIGLMRLLGVHKEVVWQASSEHEKADITAVFGDDADVVVAEDIASRQYASDLPAKQSERLQVVLLARLSPMKNLEYALRVLQQLDFPVIFDIYGPVEDQQYWSKCQILMDDMPSNVHINVKGILAPEAVAATLMRYDAFFLPTKGENYSHVIAEALCAGLPLVIADTTPWRELAEKGIGWDLPLSDQAAFVSRFKALHRMDAPTYHALRERVLGWAKERFEKPDAADANRNMFEYVLSHRGNHFGEE